jgi:hypothetical protein
LFLAHRSVFPTVENLAWRSCSLSPALSLAGEPWPSLLRRDIFYMLLIQVKPPAKKFYLHPNGQDIGKLIDEYRLLC